MSIPRVWLMLALSLLAIPLTFAVGISPSLRTLEYIPGKEYHLSFTALNAERIETYLKGDLAPYAELIDPAQGTGPRQFEVILRLPEKLEPPGKRTLLVGVLEGLPPGAAIGARAAYQAPVFIFVPFPGVYLQVDFSAPSVNTGEPVPFRISVRNDGTDFVERLSARVLVFDDRTGETVATLDAPPDSIEGSGTREFNVVWESKGYAAGAYRAKAIISYDEEIVEREVGFRVGEQVLSIVNFTKKATAGIINPFDVFVRSEWNSPFTNVYAEVDVNGTTFRSPSVGVEPWQSVTLTGYWDGSRTAPGSLPVHVRVRYGDLEANRDGTLDVVTPVIPEAPIEFGLGARVAAAAVIALVALVILFIRRRRA